MTSMRGYSGVCQDCQCFAYVWVGEQGQRCDACNTRHRVRRDYAMNPALAARVYCAATAEDALRLLGVTP